MEYRPLSARTSLGALAVVVFCLSSQAVAQDAFQGGRLYDKWWTGNGSPAPVGEHPLYPAVGQQSGNTTFRCKECHGWDYKGAAGAYAVGSSHFTGIPGVLTSAMTPAQMFDIIKNPDGDGTGGTNVNGHGFGTIGLSDADIDDIVAFLQTQLVDPAAFLNGTQFVGDPVQGEANYTGSGFCFFCHGDDGTDLNFGTPENPEWVGTVAVSNPWEFMHKIRVGQPGSQPAMPSWTQNGGSDQGAADLGLYIQQNFPTAPAVSAVPTTSEWGMLAMVLTMFAVAVLSLRYSRRATVR